jgi:hypothetical protein
MTDRDRLDAALDTLVDPFGDERVDWDDVLLRAGEQRQPTRRAGRRRAAYVVIAAVVALTALLVVNPFADRRDGVLARALAAVGDGPVIHVVTRTPPEGTVVDLGSGQRRTVRLERELWYDPARGARSVVRFAGRVMFEQGVPPDRPVQLHSIARAAEVFTRDYRDALRSGRARVLGRGEVAGEPVFWIRVRLRAARPVAFPCPSGLCQDIAVSRSTYEPVVVRYGPGQRFQERVMTLESLPAGSGTIPGPVGPRSIASFVPLQRRTVNRREARRLLGRHPVWPGREIAGLRLASIEKGGERPFRSNRPGDMRFGKPNDVITMLFGSRDAIRANRPPRRWRRLVVVSQARRVSWSLFRSPVLARPSFAPIGEYVPREGEMLLTAGGRQALMRLRGLVVTVTGSSPTLTWAATRALAARG